MTERARLPIAGQTGDRWVVPVREPHPIGVPSIAVVAASDVSARAMSEALAAAADGHVVARYRAVLRSRAGYELADEGEKVLRAHPDDMLAAIDSLLAGITSSTELVLLSGPAFLGAMRVDVGLWIGDLETALGPGAPPREVRDRLTLRIREPRPALARELVRSLLRAG